MEDKDVYEQIEKDLDKKEKALFLGEKSLSRALYTAGKQREKGKKIETRAIIPHNSSIKDEEQAINQGTRGEQSKKEGIPNTTYRIGKLEKEDKNYPIIIDEREKPVEKLPKTTENLEKNGKLLMKLPIEYFYPLKANYKSLFRKKTKKKTIEELLEEQNLKTENYEIINGLDENSEMLVKLLNKGYKKKYTDQEPISLEEFAEDITEELIPEAEKAREGTSLAVESENKKYLYHITEIKKTKGSTELKFKFPTGKTTNKTDRENRKSKKLKIELKPNKEEYREEIERTGDLIMLKKRIQDYYS